MPKRLRKHVAIVYKFARTADDIADEGEITSEERTKRLEEFEHSLKLAVRGEAVQPFWVALGNTITELNLSPDNFFNLLSAFKQDIVKKRYETFDEVLDYCRRSADPVGRIILEMNGIRNDEAFRLSDKICSALQLANFYQDVSVDIKKDRVYLSKDEMEKYGVTEKQLELLDNNSNFTKLLKFNVDRASQMFEEGNGLLEYLPMMLRFQIRWTISGGECILRKIKKQDYNVLTKRPELSKIEYCILMIKSLRAII